MMSKPKSYEQTLKDLDEAEDSTPAESQMPIHNDEGQQIGYRGTESGEEVLLPRPDDEE
jgi:hypothetical protein